MRRVLSLLCLTAFFACRPSDSATTTRTELVSERERLREQARLVLEANCGSCHLPDLATSLSAALRVYDLSETEWAARMSEPQLHDAEHRLASDLAPGGEDGTPLAVSAADRSAFGRYVEIEIEHRRLTRPVQ